jgi:hypothetical protein
MSKFNVGDFVIFENERFVICRVSECGQYISFGYEEEDAYYEANRFTLEMTKNEAKAHFSALQKEAVSRHNNKQSGYGAMQMTADNQG